jgi:hypothetical protein
VKGEEYGMGKRGCGICRVGKMKMVERGARMNREDRKEK